MNIGGIGIIPGYGNEEDWGLISNDDFNGFITGDDGSANIPGI